ncbi:hypothetical protein BDR26DRAFT_931829 [Obelidium mucronatum]|nr:hypothetical protein BDR26DRAFT_931829 [Obelidium mucronatum]
MADAAEHTTWRQRDARRKAKDMVLTGSESGLRTYYNRNTNSRNGGKSGTDRTPEHETMTEPGHCEYVETGNWNRTQCCKPNGSNGHEEPENGTGPGPSRIFLLESRHPGPPTAFWGGPSDSSNTLVYVNGHRLKHACVAVQPDCRLKYITQCT